MRRLLAGCAALVLLAGCDAVGDGTDDVASGMGSRFGGVRTYFLLDAFSVINTQKTIEDHVVSLVTGKDCSVVRASTGDHYCQDRPKAVPSVPRLTYCYKSLADVTCYDQPYERDADRLYGTRYDVVPIIQK